MIKKSLIPGFAGLIACIVSVWCLADWFSTETEQELCLRLAIDRGGVETARAVVDIEGEYQKFDGGPSAVRAVWPSFRGANRDNISTETLVLNSDWGPGGPPVLWSVELGEGYAGPAVANGCVYVLDYDHEKSGDSLRCFSLDDGREIWRRWYKVKIKRNHGMSRTVPAVSGKYVVTIGPKCHVMCVDAETGAFRWGLDLVERFATEVPLWYTGQCPLIDGDLLIVAPGGNALMAGISLETGEVVWETANPDKWQMSHSSVIPVQMHGVKMYVYSSMGGVVGVSAEKDSAGRLLWSSGEWSHSVISPSPLVVGDHKLLLTAGYGAGSMIMNIVRDGDSFSAVPGMSWAKTDFACEQHTPIYYGGRLYTVMPNDAGTLKKQLVCMDPNGKVFWTSGRQNRFGMGPFMIADGKILVMNDDGTLTMAETGGMEFRLLARARVLHGREAWAPLALADGRLLARDFTRMVCLDLRRN